MNPAEVQSDLERAARHLDLASTELANAIKEFEGTGEGTGWSPGPKFQIEALVEEAAEEIYSDYEGQDKRPPRQEICETRARKKVRREHPDLWADYERLGSRVEALQKYIGSKKQSISARQSVLSAEKTLAGVA